MRLFCGSSRVLVCSRFLQWWQLFGRHEDAE